MPENINKAFALVSIFVNIYMEYSMKIIFLILILSSFSLLEAATAPITIKESIVKAMQSPLRSEKEKLRDRNRHPVQTLLFFGLRQDMKVIELIPGGGWYTKILAQVLAENGDFSVALATKRVSDSLLGKEGMEFINYIESDANIRREAGSRFNTVDVFNFGLTDTDLIFTFRNYHNFSEEGRKRINEAVFRALKPGGIYAVIDHTRRHMQRLNDENGRRIDPVLAIKEIQAAGFLLQDYSTLHYRADDELRYEVGRKTVRGNTDRFTLKFIKPK